MNLRKFFDGATREDVVCTALLFGWIAIMINSGTIMRFLGLH